MTRLLLTFSALIVFALNPALNPAAHPAQEPASKPETAAAPAAAATPPDTKNPVKATPESLAKSKKTYGYDCAMCHGDNGDGKTDLAKDMALTMSDLSDPKTLANQTDAQIFDTIKNGKGKMPAEDLTRAKVDDLWSLVNYLRTLSKKG